MHTRKPRVSIGLPVYNGERFLEEALDSLLAQTYLDFELIISDNASTDGTREMCRAFAAKDRRVHYYRNLINIGVNRNFNRVFELSRGEYFKWASADDSCKPELLARCLDVLDNDDTVVLAYSKASFISEDKNVLAISDPGWDLRSEARHERLRYAIRARHWVNCHYGLIRADALSKTRLMPSYPGGDFRLLAELSLRGKFVEIPEALFFRRVHSGASSQNSDNLRWTMKFHTGNEERICLPLWNLNIDHGITITKSNLTLRHKLSLLAVIIRSMCWDRSRLLQELKTGFMFYWDQLNPQ
jgi:glycosyltransferase involved in cell wall biosynthesis